MSDYISREAVIDSLQDWEDHCMTDAEEWHIRQVIGDVKSLPAAEVKPVVRGSWVNNQELTRFACSSKGMYQCSECKQWIDVFQMSGEMNFCPNCGADLREEEK